MQRVFQALVTLKLYKMFLENNENQCVSVVDVAIEPARLKERRRANEIKNPWKANSWGGREASQLVITDACTEHSSAGPPQPSASNSFNPCRGRWSNNGSLHGLLLFPRYFLESHGDSFHFNAKKIWGFLAVGESLRGRWETGRRRSEKKLHCCSSDSRKSSASYRIHS
jgi:hypothetical protein